MALGTVTLHFQPEGSSGWMHEPYALKSVRYELDAATGVATVSLATPGNLNAMKRTLLWEMLACLEHCVAEDAVLEAQWALQSVTTLPLSPSARPT